MARKTWLALAGIALGAVACGGESTGPTGPLLLGEWGSATTLLVAIHSGAEIRLGCSVVIIEDPIELGPSGAFEVRGRLRPSGAIFGRLLEIRGSGLISGPRVTLVLLLGEPDGTVTYELDAGVRPNPADAPMCPQ